MIFPSNLGLRNLKEEIQEQEQFHDEVEEDIEDNQEGHNLQQLDLDSSAQTVQEEVVEEEEEEYTLNEQQDQSNSADAEQEDELVERKFIPQFNENNQNDNVPQESVQAEDFSESFSEQFEHVEVSPDMQIQEDEETSEENPDMQQTNDSDMEDYDIVDGVHITGDVSEINEEAPQEDGEENRSLEKMTVNAKILKNILKKKEGKTTMKDNRLFVYVVQQQNSEKENVGHLAPCGLKKPNPRSILKTSHPILTSQQTRNEPDNKINRRFSKGKEAVQARILNNFINKTTIPQAPIRTTRLPRKQEIKPVERMDEEIVVKEVMVGKNGFVEAPPGFIKNTVKVTEIVELTDSDEDYDPKSKSRKKRKKHRKQTTEEDENETDSDVSIIDLLETDDEENEKEQEVPTETELTPQKKRRGRPPKNASLSSPMKRMRLESSDSEQEEKKTEIPCPKCDKTFPSQNSLKTHLQHHNLQMSLQQNADKYKCKECDEKFKNSILLNGHKCAAKQRYTCLFCQKRFPDSAALVAHKRVHIKDRLVKTTTVEKISPKKIKVFKSPPVPQRGSNLKCKICGKWCSSQQILAVHVKTHKGFNCVRCSEGFPSKLMLDKHVMENCVKTGNRRSLRLQDGKEAAATGLYGNKLSCDACDERFCTYQTLFRHKVEKHGVFTPDKKVMEPTKKKMLYKHIPAHSGLPASKKLRDAFLEFKKELIKSQAQDG